MTHSDRPAWTAPEITILRSASDALVGTIRVEEEYNDEFIDKGPSGPA